MPKDKSNRKHKSNHPQDVESSKSSEYSEYTIRDLDEKFGPPPFRMIWNYYSFHISPNGNIVDMLFENDDGVRIAIPLDGRDLELIGKHFKKLEKILLRAEG